MLLLGTYVPVTGGYQKTKERNEYDKCLRVIEQRQRRLLCLIWNNRYKSKCLYFWLQTWRKCYNVVPRHKRHRQCPLTNDYNCIFCWSKNANKAMGHRIFKAKTTNKNSIQILLPKAWWHLPSTIYMAQCTTDNEKKMLQSTTTTLDDKWGDGRRLPTMILISWPCPLLQHYPINGIHLLLLLKKGWETVGSKKDV